MVFAATTNPKQTDMESTQGHFFVAAPPQAPATISLLEPQAPHMRWTCNTKTRHQYIELVWRFDAGATDISCIKEISAWHCPVYQQHVSHLYSAFATTVHACFQKKLNWSVNAKPHKFHWIVGHLQTKTTYKQHSNLPNICDCTAPFELTGKKKS